jgi:hypothetical protein
MDNLIVYDVETKDLISDQNKIFNLGIAVAVTYSYKENAYKVWGDKEEDHKKLLEYLNGATCITFNGISFDSKVLLGDNRTVSEAGTTRGNPFGDKEYGWKNFDMFTEIWKAIFKTKNVNEAYEQQKRAKQFHVKGLFNLDNIVQNTLGGTVKKLANGITAVDHYKNNNLKKLHEYCMQDVRVERELFEFVRKYRYIVAGNYDIVKLDQF